jgi:hypothetical protein
MNNFFQLATICRQAAVPTAEVIQVAPSSKRHTNFEIPVITASVGRWQADSRSLVCVYIIVSVCRLLSATCNVQNFAQLVIYGNWIQSKKWTGTNK